MSQEKERTTGSKRGEQVSTLMQAKQQLEQKNVELQEAILATEPLISGRREISCLRWSVIFLISQSWKRDR